MDGLFGLGRGQAQAQQRLLHRLARQDLHGHLLEPREALRGLGLGKTLGRQGGRGRMIGLAFAGRLAHGQSPAHREGREARRADQQARRIPDWRVSRIEFLHHSPEPRSGFGPRDCPALIHFRLTVILPSQIHA